MDTLIKALITNKLSVYVNDICIVENDIKNGIAFISIYDSCIMINGYIDINNIAFIQHIKNTLKSLSNQYRIAEGEYKTNFKEYQYYSFSII